MTTFTGGVRFLWGVAMVAAGVALSAPLVLEVVTAAWQVHNDLAVPSGTAVPPAPEAWIIPPAPQAGPTIANETSFETAPVAALGSESQPPLAEWQPPAAPHPLPPASPELAALAPEIQGTYRSTLALPPPPLLDASQPPPLPTAVGGGDPAPVAAAPQTMPAALVPRSHVVRDGDDLTGLATRYYGHPSAAGTIWAANRDRLPDPEVLPIGVEIRLPPSWSIATVHAAAGSAAIEPRPEVPAAAPAADPSPRQPGDPGALSPASWLADRQSPPSAPPGSPSRRPATVRVAAGETLASLAARFYGDSAAARAIWDVNRDRLRSPELLVPGMELRLP